MKKKPKASYPGAVPLFHELLSWQRDGSLYLAVARSGEYDLRWAMTDEYVCSVKQGILKTYGANPELCPVADKVSLTLDGDRIIFRCSRRGELLKIGALSREAARQAVSDLSDLIGPQNLLTFKRKS